jgi:hypothetical protein
MLAINIAGKKTKLENKNINLDGAREGAKYI